MDLCWLCGDVLGTWIERYNKQRYPVYVSNVKYFFNPAMGTERTGNPNSSPLAACLCVHLAGHATSCVTFTKVSVRGDCGKRIRFWKMTKGGNVIGWCRAVRFAPLSETLINEAQGVSDVRFMTCICLPNLHHCACGFGDVIHYSLWYSVLCCVYFILLSCTEQCPSEQQLDHISYYRLHVKSVSYKGFTKSHAKVNRTYRSFIFLHVDRVTLSL